MRSQVVATTVAALVVGSMGLFAQDPPKTPAGAGADPASLAEPFPAGYLDHNALTAALKRVAEAHPATVRLRSLATTAQGRDVWLATVGRPEKKDEPAKAAVLLVANLEADHVVGSQVALGIIERLAAADGTNQATSALLDRRTIYIVPRLNPDGVERLLAGKPRSAFRTNLRAVDRDRDRKAGEDGPDDLDGDGLATQMRVKDAKATMIADAKDARLARKADPVKGERPEFSEYAEGIDDDGDGQLNEDPAGGVNLNRNWPHRWTEFDPETGYSPASEPEVHALIAWAYEHPEIGAVWTFSLNDNLRVEPRKPGSTLDDADLPYFAELSKLHGRAGKPAADEPQKKDAPEEAAPDGDRDRPVAPAKGAGTGERTKGRAQARAQVQLRNVDDTSPAPAAAAVAVSTGDGGGLEGTTDGAMSEWAYHQFGVVGLASRLWPGPDPPASAGGGGGRGAPARPVSDLARWLDWNDHEVGGRAFVPFHEVDHPSLGKVAVGGWKPGVRLNPPAGRIAAIVDVELAFLKELAGKLPTLAVSDVKVESKGAGLFEIRAVVTNEGYLPTAMAQGVRTRRVPPVLVRLKAESARLLVGKPLDRLSTLAGSGGRKEYRWLLLVPETMKSVTLDVSCPQAGHIVKELELK